MRWFVFMDGFDSVRLGRKCGIGIIMIVLNKRMKKKPYLKLHKLNKN